MMEPKIIPHPFGDRTYTSALYYGADVRESLKGLPADSVQCVVTSPPYWGLRSYLPEISGLKSSEVGLETTPEVYVSAIVSVFREVRRVLREDGVLWLNLGDSFSRGDRNTVPVHRGALSSEYDKERYLFSSPAAKMGGHPTIKPKDLVGIPWMVAFALRADGWYLRSDVIWSKSSCMPESVTDRPTRSHEYVFLLTKNSRYLYDADAVREGAVQAGRVRADKIGGNKGDETHHSPGSIFEGSTTRNRRSVWNINPKPYKGAHFATMPTALAEVCIKAGSRPGDTVLDPFSGSGTTGYVANRLGRNYVGTDLNPDYLPLAEARLMGRDPPENGEPSTEVDADSILDLLGT